ARNLLLDEKNKKIVKPYIGGKETNETFDHAYNRWVIDFGDRSVEECQEWPELFELVVNDVKPYRTGLPKTSNNKGLISRWWQFGHRASDLYEMIEPLSRVIACSQ